jgi:hypothetical protein
MLVTVGHGGDRPPDPESPPVDAAFLAEHLRELDAAGADDVILVLDPINESSVAAVAEEFARNPPA